MSSNGVFTPQRNPHRNAGPTLKRRSDSRGCGSTGGFQEERNRYAPPQKRARSQMQTPTQTQSQFRSVNPGRNPLYHHGSNVSRVSHSNNYGDVMNSNSSNSFPFAVRNNNHSPSMNKTNTDYQKPFGYNGIPDNLNQRVPLPLPYRKLDDDVSFDSLPEWVPNQSASRTLNRFIPNYPIVSQAPPVFTNFQNPMSMNHQSNMLSIVSQALPQPIVSKELSDLLSALNNNEKQNPEVSPLGLSFDDPSLLKVRHESVIKSLYSDLPRQCTSCGVRFKCQEDHSNHMDWHVRKNRMSKPASNKSSTKAKKSRNWFASSSLWLTEATGGAKGAAPFTASGEAQKKKEEEQQQLVIADENQKTCALCEEPFEEFFSHEADEWLYKDAAYLNRNEQTATIGPIVHAKCMPETRKGRGKESRAPMVMSVTVPPVASALVC